MTRRAAVVATALAALGMGGCGDDDRPLPPACSRSANAVTRALQDAPGPVALEPGTKLSTCVERARSTGDIQTVGAIYTEVADGLAVRAKASDRAALELGYLVGAAHRGGRHTNGIHEELLRRLDQAIGLDGAPRARQGAYQRGLRAGESRG